MTWINNPIWTTPTYQPYEPVVTTKELNVNVPKPQIKPLIKIISDTSYLCVLNHPDGSGNLVLAEFIIEPSNQLVGFGKPKIKFQTTIFSDLEDGSPYFYTKDRDGKPQKASTLDGLIALVFL